MSGPDLIIMAETSQIKNVTRKRACYEKRARRRGWRWVRYSQRVFMTNFFSKELQRSFPELTFVGVLATPKYKPKNFLLFFDIVYLSGCETLISVLQATLNMKFAVSSYMTNERAESLGRQ